MSKIKLISIIAVGLFLTNVFLLWQLKSHKPSRMHRPKPKTKIIEMLQLDDAQVAIYEELIKEHHKITEGYQDSINILNSQIYMTLKENGSAINLDSTYSKLGLLNIEINKAKLQHFKDIKALCKPEQLPLYNSFCDNITELFSRPKMNEGEPKR